ncbi:MAG: family 1 glycosylhydrolase [Anaerolineales bacterium]
MAQATVHFPRGFLWGTATAAHQVEGNNTNNSWYRWEQNGHIADQAGLACDWWGGSWKEDMDRAAETSHNALRFSVEWSRIQPEPERWDEDALERYRMMARGMVERGITPLVTLHHFSDPLWLYDRCGWEMPGIAPAFEKYARKVVEALKEYVTTWVTINEPNLYALNGYVTGAFPGCAQGFGAALRVLANLLRGHAAAYRAIHEIQPEARVGYALHYRPMVAARPWFPLDVLMRNIQYAGVNMAFPSAISSGVMKSPMGNVRIPEVKGLQDYLGINYYSVDTIKFDITNRKELFGKRYYPAGSDLSTTQFIANTPNGLFDTLKWATTTYPNLPLLVTENGVEDDDDKMRPRYIAQHVHQMWRAVNYNWPVKGYFYWTLVDNFEWERGWTQRFGLWGLDRETQARTRRSSADLYSDICTENGLSSGMVAKYCPEVLQKIFPD